jgi:hypothetical protein
MPMGAYGADISRRCSLKNSLRRVIAALEGLEAHVTEGDARCSAMLNTVFITLLHTVGVVIVVHVSNSSSKSSGGSAKCDNKSYPSAGASTHLVEFDATWYAGSGSILLLLLSLHAFAIHMPPLMQYYSYMERRRRLLGELLGERQKSWGSSLSSEDQDVAFAAVSQRELNEQLLGPYIRVGTRMGQQLVVVAVAIAFGSGIPLLYMPAVISCAIGWALDKLLLLHFYQV